ncbi:hypothetical protein I7I48_09112 [Histoplasma ohiense]|nr:hypothetical protein I7I48_09112 [Histoplasma ohiense (nom. inval.)]
MLHNHILFLELFLYSLLLPFFCTDTRHKFEYMARKSDDDLNLDLIEYSASSSQSMKDISIDNRMDELAPEHHSYSNNLQLLEIDVLPYR